MTNHAVGVREALASGMSRRRSLNRLGKPTMRKPETQLQAQRLAFSIELIDMGFGLR